MALLALVNKENRLMIKDYIGKKQLKKCKFTISLFSFPGWHMQATPKWLISNLQISLSLKRILENKVKIVIIYNEYGQSHIKYL